MSNFPDFIYRLTPRDEQVTPLESVTYYHTESLVSTYVDIDESLGAYRVPAGKILLVNTLAVDFSAGAAQNLDSYKIYLKNSSATNDATLTGHSRILTGRYGTQGHMFGSIIVPSEWYICAVALFSAGAAANQITLGMTGTLIPRGNFAI